MSSLITRIKRIDPIYAFLVVVIVIFGISWSSKFLNRIGAFSTTDKGNVQEKQIGTYKISKICFDDRGISECTEIGDQPYRFILYRSNQDDKQTLYIKDK